LNQPCRRFNVTIGRRTSGWMAVGMTGMLAVLGRIMGGYLMVTS
jgi:hypothetical protein